jgi:hypothetical protein
MRNYNYQLSQRRADAVVNYLATKYNIPPHKFYLIGIGKDQQVASDSTAAGRAKNRRVDIKLMTNMGANRPHRQPRSERPIMSKSCKTNSTSATNPPTRRIGDHAARCIQQQRRQGSHREMPALRPLPFFTEFRSSAFEINDPSSAEVAMTQAN